MKFAVCSLRSLLLLIVGIGTITAASAGSFNDVLLIIGSMSLFMAGVLSTVATER